MVKSCLYKKYKNELGIVVGTCNPRYLVGLRQENHWNPGDGVCSKPKWQHYTPAWVTEKDFVSPKKKKKEGVRDPGTREGKEAF